MVYKLLVLKNTLIFLVILLIVYTVNCDESKNVETTVKIATTTEAPKIIKIKDTNLCKKCDCYESKLLLDCKDRNLNEWFTNDELNAMQYDKDYQFETILMNNNNLSEIKQLPSLINLKELNFNNNSIKKIENGAFVKLNSLKKLDLSNNLLDTKNITRDVFKGRYNPDYYQPMINLTDLNLSGNKIHSFQADVFEHFPHLEKLNLSYNSFDHIDDSSKNAISSLGYIKELDLSSMGLSELPKFIFNYHKYDLKILHLNGNKFENIPIDALGKAIGLEVLHLNENPLIKLDENNKFPILSNLNELHMSNCPNLTSIEAESLSGLRNLTKLFITNNPSLKTIHANALAYYPEKSLEIAFPPLKLLSLENNNIEVLPSKLFGNWDQIDIINLQKNPWTCTCINDFLINELINKIRNKKADLLDNMLCNGPDQFKNVQMKNFNTENGITIKCSLFHPQSSVDDYTIMTGLLIGIAISIPLVFFIVIAYRRGCFGFYNPNDPARFSRAFYSRTVNDDFI